MDPNSVSMVIKYKWKHIFSNQFDVMCTLLKQGIGEAQVIMILKAGFASTEQRVLTLNWKETGLISLKHSSPS